MYECMYLKSRDFCPFISLQMTKSETSKRYSGTCTIFIYIGKMSRFRIHKADWVRLYRLHETNTIYLNVLRTAVCESVYVLYNCVQWYSLHITYGLTPVNKPPQPSCRSPSPPTLHMGLLRPHATLLSKSQKKLHRLALPTSPKRSGDHALNLVFLTPANNNLPKPPDWCAPCEQWELDCTNLFQASGFMIGGTIWFIRVNSQGERVWFDGKNERSGGTNSQLISSQRTRQPSTYTIRASISLGERENYRMELRWGGEGSHRGYPEDRRMGLQMLVSPVSTDLSQKTCS